MMHQKSSNLRRTLGPAIVALVIVCGCSSGSSDDADSGAPWELVGRDADQSTLTDVDDTSPDTDPSLPTDAGTDAASPADDEYVRTLLEQHCAREALEICRWNYECVRFDRTRDSPWTDSLGGVDQCVVWRKLVFACGARVAFERGSATLDVAKLAQCLQIPEESDLCDASRYLDCVTDVTNGHARRSSPSTVSRANEATATPGPGRAKSSGPQAPHVWRPTTCAPTAPAPQTGSAPRRP